MSAIILLAVSPTLIIIRVKRQMKIIITLIDSEVEGAFALSVFSRSRQPVRVPHVANVSVR